MIRFGKKVFLLKFPYLIFFLIVIVIVIRDNAAAGNQTELSKKAIAAKKFDIKPQSLIFFSHHFQNSLKFVF
jgi:hypothetical protein